MSGGWATALADLGASAGAPWEGTSNPGTERVRVVGAALLATALGLLWWATAAVPGAELTHRATLKVLLVYVLPPLSAASVMGSSAGPLRGGTRAARAFGWGWLAVAAAFGGVFAGRGGMTWGAAWQGLREAVSLSDWGHGIFASIVLGAVTAGLGGREPAAGSRRYGVALTLAVLTACHTAPHLLAARWGL